jgi:hypothetical protein
MQKHIGFLWVLENSVVLGVLRQWLYGNILPQEKTLGSVGLGESMYSFETSGMDDLVYGRLEWGATGTLHVLGTHVTT